MKQPFVIRILIWLAALATVGMYLSILLVYLRIAPPRMGGEIVTRSDWLHVAAPLVAVIGILMALSSYGLASRKVWVRIPVMAIPILIFVYAIATRTLGWISAIIMWRALINSTLLGCASAWYFYFKPNVRWYFRSLSEKS